MSISKMRFLALFLFLTLTSNAFAYWPTTVEQNLAVSALPDTNEMQCSAISYPNNSTLVVFKKFWVGLVYQIIDQYGQLEYPLPQKLTPAILNLDNSEPRLIPDGAGGAFVAWLNYFQGIIAQRLDSLGNIMWGDSGKVISPFIEQDFDISIDGQGGFFLAVSRDSELVSDVFVQRINDNGDTLWGEQGFQVSLMQVGGSKPKITCGLQGDVYVVWYDWRPPYGNWGAVFAQRLNSEGQRMWPNDLFIGEHSYGHKVIPDGQGGFILQANPGGVASNTHWRIGPDGRIIWIRGQLSWYYWADMVLGEPGILYLGFNYGFGIYGQRVRISDGANYWPTGTAQPGALMAYHEGWGQPGHNAYIYKNSYFSGVFDYSVNASFPKNLYCQALDSLGNRSLGLDGILLTTINQYSYQDMNIIVDDDSGIIAVFRYGTTSGPYNDVLAKRANFNGTLGGPYPPIEELNITIDDSNAVLTWPSMNDTAQYHIYKSTEPYSFPAIPDTTISDTCYIDIGVVSEGEQFYRVTWELEE